MTKPNYDGNRTTLLPGGLPGVKQIDGWGEPRPEQPRPTVTNADMQRDILAAAAARKVVSDLVNEVSFWINSTNSEGFLYFQKALQNFEPYQKAERFRAERAEQKRLAVQNNRARLAGNRT